MHSAERLALSLLRQLCDLGHGFASDDLNTYSSGVGSSPSNPKLSESAEMKPQDDEIAAAEGSQTVTGDDGFTPSNPPTCEPTEEAAEFRVENFTDTQGLNTTSRARAEVDPLLKVLLDALGEVFSSINETVFVVIDALDEENMEPSVVDGFYAVLSKLHSLDCRLFLTSRNEPSSQIPFTYISLHISESWNLKDIESFVRSRLENLFDAFAIAEFVRKIPQINSEELPQVIAKKSRGT